MTDTVTPSGREHRRPRLAVVVSHPIPYYVPLYRALAAEGAVQVKAFYCSRIGVDKGLDPSGMGVEIEWATDLLGGYLHEFLPEASRIHQTSFKGVNNPSITSRLEQYRPDIVLLHGYAQKTMVRALAWCRRRSVPAMMISDRSFSGLTTLLRRTARRFVLPIILKQFDAVLVIGDRVEEFYRSFGVRAEQIFRVPNMIDQRFWLARQGRLAERARVRARLGVDDEFIALYVGKLIDRKRPQDLLAALRSLRGRAASQRSISVLFAGDGKLRCEMEAAAKAEALPARFHGFVNIDELPGLYCAADVLSHPAENESFGLIAVEAATCGLPLILSDRVGAVGPTSIARPDHNTLVHACGDTIGLARAIGRLADDSALALAMARSSLALSQDHDGRVSVANTLKAIEFCLTRTKSRRSAVAEAAP